MMVRAVLGVGVSYYKCADNSRSRVVALCRQIVFAGTNKHHVDGREALYGVHSRFGAGKFHGSMRRRRCVFLCTCSASARKIREACVLFAFLFHDVYGLDSCRLFLALRVCVYEH